MTTVDQLCTRARVAASVVHELAGWDEVTELALRLAGDGHVALAPSVLKAHPELAAALDGRLCQLDPAAPFESAADVAVGITVDREGTITGLQILVPSGISGFDNAATGSVRAADLLPLPADYPDDRFDIILVFWYNERPYDLFG